MSNSDAEATDFNTAEQLSLSARAEGKVKINRSQGDYSSLKSISVDSVQEHFRPIKTSVNEINEFLVSKEIVVLRRWERSKQKFGFIKRVDKG